MLRAFLHATSALTVELVTELVTLRCSFPTAEPHTYITLALAVLQIHRADVRRLLRLGLCERVRLLS